MSQLFLRRHLARQATPVLMTVFCLCSLLTVSVLAEDSGTTIKCIPVELTVSTTHEGMGVFMGLDKGSDNMQSMGYSPSLVKFLAVVAEKPGAKKPIFGLLPDGAECPTPADFDESELTPEWRYFYIDPLHSGYEPIRNKKKKIVKIKEVQKAIAAGDEKIETKVKFSMTLPTGSSMPGAGGPGAGGGGG